MQRMTLSAILLGAIVVAGCSGSNDPFNQPQRQVQPEQFGVTTDQVDTVPPASVGTNTAPVPAPAAASSELPPAPPEVSEESSSAAPPAPPTVREEAKPGVTGKGTSYGGGVITTPVSVYFQTKERIVFDIQIPDAMRLYKAEHGRAPQSHDEYMQKIIKANMINLPQLPPGHKYVYDPQTEQLMVERPQ